MIRKTSILLQLFAFCSFLISVCQLSSQTNYLNQANTAIKKGAFGEATELLEKAKTHCGEDLLVQHNSAILAARQGDKAKAIELLNESITSDKENASYHYNRAIVYLEAKDYISAISDLKMAAELGSRKTSKLKSEAYKLKKLSEEKQLVVLEALAKVAQDDGDYKTAAAYYDEALALRPDEQYYLFSIIQLSLLERNPFVTLEAIEPFRIDRLSADKKLELTLAKAYSLGRINKVYDAIGLLEEFVYRENISDPRPRQLLSYYYLKLSKNDKAIEVLKGQVYHDANTYVIAGNAALYNKKYELALRCFKKARFLDAENTNAGLGIALSLANNNRQSRAIEMIDSLAVAHPDNHYVWNTKGIIYKDIGLSHKNRHRQKKANRYFVVSAAAFLAAQQANANLKSSFENNRALALYFQEKQNEARSIWVANDKLGSQNNLALLKASQRDFRSAYDKLDSLYDSFYKLNKKRHSLLAHNRSLARSRTKLNNNYKFVTYYFLTQDLPDFVVKNLFDRAVESESTAEAFDYILEYSDKECVEKVDRKKVKKKRKFRLFKRKKKKYNGDCPSF